MAINNVTVLDTIWLNGTNDYQQRVPRCTQESITATVKTLSNPANTHLWNEFCDSLVNRIGMEIVRARMWENPLAIFKRGMLEYGNTIEEIAFRDIKAHGYELYPDETSLFRPDRPPVETLFHKANFFNKYRIDINQTALQYALRNDGLASFVSGALDLPLLWNNNDEYRTMLQLLKEMKDTYGFYQIQVADVNSLTATRDEVAQFSKQVRATVNQMKFMKPYFNAKGVPTFANPEDLVLLATPNVIANLDVEVLADAFNMSKADVTARVIMVDEFPTAKTVAILMSKDWFVCADTVFQTASFYNPDTLGTKYILHHQGIFSASTMMPLVEFTTDAATVPAIVTESPTTLDMEVVNQGGVAVTSLKSGERYFVNLDLAGTVNPANGNVKVLPDAATYAITSGTSFVYSNKTRVDNEGYLRIEKDVPADTPLILTATATYANPSGDTVPITKSLTLTVNETP